MNKLQENLKKLRTISKKTQDDIASYLGVTRQAYGNYENGVREPELDAVIKLADYYGVTLDELVGRENVNTSNNISKLVLRDEIEASVKELVNELAAKNIEDIIRIIEKQYKL